MSKKVIYKGQLFTILFRYETGYYEIRELTNPFNVKLVHHSELTTIHTRDKSNSFM